MMQSVLIQLVLLHVNASQVSQEMAEVVKVELTFSEWLTKM
jgi:hypothetical protein